MDWDNNLDNISKAIELARQEKVDILCLPELCLTGYGCQDLFLSEWLPEKALHALVEVMEKCSDIIVVLGLPIRFEHDVYNCAAIIDNQQLLGFYAKQNLASDGVYYEFRWFKPWPGDNVEKLDFAGKQYPLGNVVFDLKGLKTAFEICEDAWVTTNRPAKSHSTKNVDLIINPSASHFEFLKTQERQDLFISSSRDYDCTYLYCNLLGNESGQLIFDGEVIIARKGELLNRSETLVLHNIEMVSADVPLDASRQLFGIEKIQADPKFEFTKAITLGLFDYLRKSKCKGFVLSLSGGADSSTVAVMVADTIKRAINELGYKKFLEKSGTADVLQDIDPEEEKDLVKTVTGRLLTCVFQGTRFSSDETLQSAKALSNYLGAAFFHWDISDAVDLYIEKVEKVIKKQLSWHHDDIALQNIQARGRSPGIWMLANIKNALLLVTSNRSEGIVGYATMDGDTSGSLAPLAGVDKHFIRQWLIFAEQSLGYKVLEHVNKLQPTAELRPKDQDQTDEEDLMPYTILARIEREAIENKKSPVETYQILKNEHLEDDSTLALHIIDFFRMVAASQWKRERTAPSFSLDTFNINPRSWLRMPILSGSFQREILELKKLVQKDTSL